MGWAKGQSGRPVGRPHNATKSNSITTALRKAICENKFDVLLPDGTTFSRIPKDVMAEYLASAVMTGIIRLPTGEELQLSPTQFLETMRDIVTRLDGPPIVTIDQTNRNVLQFDAKDTIFDNEVVDVTESGADEVE